MKIRSAKVGGIAVAITMILSAVWLFPSPSRAQSYTIEIPSKCTEDAMLVFDASASMAGASWDMRGFQTRYAAVRAALADVLPRVDRFRDLGLMVYGPGPLSCHNINLRLPPARHSAAQIMRGIDSTSPAGRTPMASAVRQAAELLDYRNKPGVIVLITDGEDTCGGMPCDLARMLKETGRDTTVHVIGYVSRGSGGPVSSAQCLATTTGGLYITAETTDELVAALKQTLACPKLSSLGPVD